VQADGVVGVMIMMMMMMMMMIELPADRVDR
jgi:hypothetical protein